MRIDTLDVRNFKKFKSQSLNLHPQFTLLVGENGSGKTSILDAISVALGVWLLDVPDSAIVKSRRPIFASEIRLEQVQEGDRVLFREAWDGAEVRASGVIFGNEITHWAREIPMTKRTTNDHGTRAARNVIADLFQRSISGEPIVFPIISYYGAGRSWMPQHRRSDSRSRPEGPARRWGAFYDCLNQRIRLADLTEWFQTEAISAINRGGKYRPGFEVVRQAVLGCVPGASDLWYDGDRKEICLSINGSAQPFSNLSAGQHMMLAMVADIAIKAVTQNNFLVPPEAPNHENGSPPRVLTETPGVILIDELDVHLHPRWQRRIANDLKKTFPKMQFVCTTHSPQVIGEVPAEQIRILSDGTAEAPGQSFGMDSNWILQVLMESESQTAEIRDDIAKAFDLISQRQLDKAESVIGALIMKIGTTADIQKAKSLIERARVLGK